MKRVSRGKVLLLVSFIHNRLSITEGQQIIYDLLSLADREGV